MKDLLVSVKNFYDKHNLRYVECTWLTILHFFGLLGLIHVIFFNDDLFKLFCFHSIFHYCYGLGITAGCHRLWAHKSYQASPLLRFILMLFNSGANQGSIFHWSRDHRLHHKFSDTQLDPHTMKNGFFFAHVGWLLVNKTKELVEEGKKLNLEDLMADKIVMFQKKHYLPLSILMCFVIPTTVYAHFLNVSFIVAYYYAALTYCIILNATWCVNSVCHMYGSRPWNKNILPSDNYFVSLITHGEGFHNWHHEFPSDWKGSKDEWYMWNPTARFIQLNKFLGLAKVK